MSTLWKLCSHLQVVRNIVQPRTNLTEIVQREMKKRNPPPRKRLSPWLIKPDRALSEDYVTTENKEFIKEVIHDKYPVATNHLSPLKVEPIEPIGTWKPSSRRTGLLAKKIGVYPLWTKNGRQVLTTLLQVIDNHVMKYIPPEDFNPKISRKPKIQVKTPRACIIVGAESTDPQFFTKAYTNLYKESGVMPKKTLARFMVSPDAALQPGTPLFATHYKPGDYVDIRGKTVDRGFQGVMKRWGFKGMPATHGVTKTHRRPGNIGAGSRKRVIPGTKLPGHMGNRYRILKGVKILRINTKYNVMWVLGKGIPGENNNTVQIYDTILPLRKFKEPPAFPTYCPTGEEPEELLLDEIHNFKDPSIEFEKEEATK